MEDRQMDCPTCQFGELASGTRFDYRGQLYRKESARSAVLLRWCDGEEVAEYVSQRFFSEIVVSPLAPERAR